MKTRFKMPSTFATNAYLAVSCWYKVVPANGVYPLLLQYFNTWKFGNMYSRAIIVVPLQRGTQHLSGIIELLLGKHTKNWRLEKATTACVELVDLFP